MAPQIQLSHLQTEHRNENSKDIDRVDTLELCRIINSEDKSVAQAVEKCLPVIAETIELVAERVRKGGRMIYVGAGTSGRLGVLDASELPPTYSVSASQFPSFIAGGDTALRSALEGAEDSLSSAQNDLQSLSPPLSSIDTLIGIAASGRTPYVLESLRIAKEKGCLTIGIACVSPSEMSKEADKTVEIVTGPEVVTGSTRMKAGTGTKMVLNMISTGVMIRVGKTFGNMMIDLKATNLKLEQRARNIIRNLCPLSSSLTDAELDTLSQECGGSVKIAVAALSLNITAQSAKERLEKAGGILSTVLSSTERTYENGNYVITNGDDQEILHEKFVLCIDAGGSKTAALILSKSGIEGRGYAGGCNITTLPIHHAIRQISLSITNAISALPPSYQKSLSSFNFEKTWIGTAGYDRPTQTLALNTSMEDLFKRKINGLSLKVGNDIEMLVRPAAALAANDGCHVKEIFVLVAGTGAVCMHYRLIKNSNLEREGTGNEYQRISRKGGWGHLLGDDGSGFWIGREAIRFALDRVDILNMLQKNETKDLNNVTLNEMDILTVRILEYFGIAIDWSPSGVEKGIDLLSSILSPCQTASTEDGEDITKRIAGVARIVLDVSSESEVARNILEKGSHSLIKCLQDLVQVSGVRGGEAMLVLAGGLMQSGLYQGMIRKGLGEKGRTFKRVETVCDTVGEAARCLVGEI